MGRLVRRYTVGNYCTREMYGRSPSHLIMSMNGKSFFLHAKPKQMVVFITPAVSMGYGVMS